MSERLLVLVLTEDTGDDAHATIAAIAKKVFLLLEPGLDERRLSFGRAEERARAGMGFNCYKSSSPRDYDKKVALAQAIATHLLVDDVRTAVFVTSTRTGHGRRETRITSARMCAASTRRCVLASRRCS